MFHIISNSLLGSGPASRRSTCTHVQSSVCTKDPTGNTPDVHGQVSVRPCDGRPDRRKGGRARSHSHESSRLSGWSQTRPRPRLRVCRTLGTHSHLYGQKAGQQSSGRFGGRNYRAAWKLQGSGRVHSRGRGDSFVDVPRCQIA